MKILEITECSSHMVETDEGEFERCSADNWMERMGESFEPVYNCEELEVLFQGYVKKARATYGRLRFCKV